MRVDSVTGTLPEPDIAASFAAMTWLIVAWFASAA